jgi:hypothetical protein
MLKICTNLAAIPRLTPDIGGQAGVLLRRNITLPHAL